MCNSQLVVGVISSDIILILLYLGTRRWILDCCLRPIVNERVSEQVQKKSESILEFKREKWPYQPINSYPFYCFWIWLSLLQLHVCLQCFRPHVKQASGLRLKLETAVLLRDEFICFTENWEKNHHLWLENSTDGLWLANHIKGSRFYFYLPLTKMNANARRQTNHHVCTMASSLIKVKIVECLAR